MVSFRQSRLIVALLFAVALLTRASIPAGWMPSLEQNEVQILLCTGHGPASVVIDDDGRVHKDGPQAPGQDEPCPYGLGSSKAFDLPPAIALALPPIDAERSKGAALAAFRFAPWRSVGPPVRGPPALA